MLLLNPPPSLTYLARSFIRYPHPPAPPPPPSPPPLPPSPLPRSPLLLLFHLLHHHHHHHLLLLLLLLSVTCLRIRWSRLLTSPADGGSPVLGYEIFQREQSSGAELSFLASAGMSSIRMRDRDTDVCAHKRWTYVWSNRMCDQSVMCIQTSPST